MFRSREVFRVYRLPISLEEFVQVSDRNRQQRQRDDKKAHERRQEREEDDKKVYENRQQQQRKDRKAYEKRQLSSGKKKDMKEYQGRMKSGPGVFDSGRSASEQQPSIHADKHPDYDFMDAENEKDRAKESYQGRPYR